MEIISNVSFFTGVLTALAFVVNIIVQLTKEIVTIPTKLWCVIVSMSVSLSSLCIGNVMGKTYYSVGSIMFAIFSSFIVAYVAMYGFDTFKELWERFKRGENINGNN